MKKATVLFLIFVLFLTLTGCHPEKDVELLIDSIGAVALESEDQISQAQSAYDALSQKEKEKVENVQLLEEAKEELARQKVVIEEAKLAIGMVGMVTVDDAEAIASARKAYDEAIRYTTADSLAVEEKELVRTEEELAELLDYIAETETAIQEAMDMLSWGKYADAANLTSELRARFPEDRLGEREAELLVELHEVIVASNAWEAKRLLQEQKIYDAMLWVSMCEPYIYDCSEEVLEILAESAFGLENILVKNRPENGTVIGRTNKPGRNTLEFTAGDLDTAVKVELREDPTQYVTVYVRAGETVKINLLNGKYTIKYTAGPYWFDEDVMFGPDATYFELSEEMELAGYTNSSTYTTYWHEVTWEPIAGYGDDMGYQNMDPEDF